MGYAPLPSPPSEFFLLLLPSKSEIRVQRTRAGGSRCSKRHMHTHARARVCLNFKTACLYSPAADRSKQYSRRCAAGSTRTRNFIWRTIIHDDGGGGGLYARELLSLPLSPSLGSTARISTLWERGHPRQEEPALAAPERAPRRTCVCIYIAHLPLWLCQDGERTRFHGNARA